MKYYAAAAVVVLGVLLLGAALPTPLAYHDAASPVKYFYSPSCAACLAVKPTLEKLAAEGYFVNALDVLRNESLWEEYSLEGTPTWLAANGDRIIGVQGEARLREWLYAHGAKLK